MFAEGKQAEEAKKAGADIVGGLELCDAVSILVTISLRYALNAEWTIRY